MNQMLADHLPQVLNNLRSGLTGSEGRSSLLSTFDGAHPIELKKALIDAGAIDLALQIFGQLDVGAPFLHKISRDDNPVLNFWPFTSESASRIADIATRFDSIALLGAPTIFSHLINCTDKEVILFERDDYFFAAGTPGFFKCDLVSDIPEQFNNHFDCVIGDPPWYLDEYRAWFETALKIVQQNGTISFVLFPKGIRPSAESERNEVVLLASENLSNVSIRDGIVEYETPSFEQVEMIANGIRPLNWRRASLLSGQVKKSGKSVYTSQTTDSTSSWIERRIGCGRIFVDLKNSSNGKEFLEYADEGSRFLSSPSRRNPSRQKANVLSSRGHGIRCNDPARLLKLVEQIESSEDIYSVSSGLSHRSEELLIAIATDLWGRFIVV